MSSQESGTRVRILEATWQLVEQRRAQDVRMGDIAKAAGMSRQALYLHFASRAELLVATTHYVDQVKGLHARNSSWRAAETGTELLDTYVEFWARYIPEIYGLGRALLAVRDTDEAAATAWDDRMVSLRKKGAAARSRRSSGRDGLLAAEWSCDEATDIFWTTLSLRNWEQFTVGCGWSLEQYITRTQRLLKRVLIQQTG